MSTSHSALILLFKLPDCPAWCGLRNKEDQRVTSLPSRWKKRDGETRGNDIAEKGSCFLDPFILSRCLRISLLLHLSHKFTDKVRSCVGREEGIFRGCTKNLLQNGSKFQVESMAPDPDNHKFSMIDHINLAMRLNPIKAMSQPSPAG